MQQYGGTCAAAGIGDNSVAVDMQNQMNAILAYNNAQGSSNVTELNAQPDPVTAADFYSQVFERPVVTDSDVRPSVAQSVYAFLTGTPTPPSPSPVPGKEYTIQAGDTLFSIATGAYGPANAGAGVAAIEAANPGIDPDDLQIGQEIMIPVLGGTGAPVPQISASLTARDPLASTNAQSVYARLVAMENAARAGSSPMTIIGQHIEGQNELYNPGYGDTGGTTYVGYYYNKVEAITGKLPAFVEIDMGPGWGSANGWGIFNERSYDSSQNLPAAQKQWQYVDDAVDLAFGVWKGFPRTDDGTYNYNGLAINIDGSTSVTAPLANGGSAAGIVGSSFHQPYPGSALKDFSQVLDQVQGQPPGGSQYGYPPATISTDQDWFDSVVDWNDNTPQYQELLADLSVLAAQLSYFAEYDIPVLFRPYHEMNSGSFWWGNKTAASYQGLWRIMYNYLVNTRGLHNLIFVWAPSAWTPDGGDVPWNYYPGSGYVDIVAVDDYNAQYGTGAPTPETASFTNIYYSALADYAKPRMLAETYSVPINSSTANGNALTVSPWVIWSIWGDYLTSSNSNAAVKDSYYATEYVYTGGSGSGYGQNFNWGNLHAD
jgi:mannan endo-1,4-beta-mannosidase